MSAQPLALIHSDFTMLWELPVRSGSGHPPNPKTVSPDLPRALVTSLKSQRRRRGVLRRLRQEVLVDGAPEPDAGAFRRELQNLGALETRALRNSVLEMEELEEEALDADDVVEVTSEPTTPPPSPIMVPGEGMD
ncbi:unnamed protein product [Symbiodinium natans]|uniref:Uncharacterized protein n=1 Tax=Symbiodinium natans TaxID=878477 RepID=A0A812UNT2_9DINO|nr:unnamed protein product [Symbiodinium natans]